jgi:hypothetical protein
VLIRSAVHAAIRDAPNARGTRKIIPEFILSNICYSQRALTDSFGYMHIVSRNPRIRARARKRLVTKLLARRRRTTSQASRFQAVLVDKIVSAKRHAKESIAPVIGARLISLGRKFVKNATTIVARSVLVNRWYPVNLLFVTTSY